MNTMNENRTNQGGDHPTNISLSGSDNSDTHDSEPILDAQNFQTYIERKRNKKVNRDIGTFAKPLTHNKSAGSPKVGMLHFDAGNKLKKFVYVPEDYDFTIYSNMEMLLSLLEGVNTAGIDNVFRFPMNFSVTPGDSTKQTLEKWRTEIEPEDENLKPLNQPETENIAKDEKLKSLVHEKFTIQPETENIEMALDSFPDPTHTGKNKGKIKRVEEDLENIFSAISDFENTVFLLTDPFKGNKLSEIALKALDKSENTTVQSIGLFHTGEIDSGDILDGRLTVLRDYSCKVGGSEENQNQITPPTPYEEKIRRDINKARENKERMMFSAFDEKVPFEKGKNEQTDYYRTRIPIPDTIFSLNTVPYDETPTRAIQVDCGLSDGEKKFKETHRDITYIPGGLADKCDHILVFTSQTKLIKFTRHICDLNPSGVFACGGSEREFEVFLDALKNGKPLFALEGCGFVAAVSRYFFKRTAIIQHHKDLSMKRREDMKNLQKKLRKLMSPNRLSQIGGDSIYDLEYEVKFRELVDSIKEHEIYCDEDEQNKRCFCDPTNKIKSKINVKNETMNPFPIIITNVEFKGNDAVYKAVPRAGGQQGEIKSPVAVEGNEDQVNAGEATSPKNSLSSRSLMQGNIGDVPVDFENESPNIGNATSPILGATSPSAGAEQEDSQLDRQNHIDSRLLSSNSGDKKPTEFTLEAVPNSKILGNQKETRQIYYKMIERLNSRKKHIGWILVQFDINATDDLAKRVKALKDASNISYSLKNFMDFPNRELKIDQTVKTANLPILEIDSNGNILKKNAKVEELLQGIKDTTDKKDTNDNDPKTNVYDVLAKKLHNATIESDKKKLKDFLQLENHFNNHSEISVTMKFGNEENPVVLKMVLILRRQRDDKTIFGAFILFHEKSFKHDTKDELTYPLPNALKLIEKGSLVTRLKADAISHFIPDAFAVIKRQEKTDGIKEEISKVMSTASDKSTELDGTTYNNKAIDECLEMIRVVKRSRKRYGTNAILLQVTVQCLVVLTTVLTILPHFCETYKKKECKIKKSAFSATIIILPIIAGALQSFIYCSRPRWKSAHLLLLEKRLKSEMYKFRARVGPYGAYDSKKKGLNEKVRKKFVVKLNALVNECMIKNDIKSGTIHNTMTLNLYDRYIAPLVAMIKARNSRTSDGDLNAINNDGLLGPQVWPLCCGQWRRTRRLNRTDRILQRTEKRTQDIEAQRLKKVHSTHLDKNERDLFDDLKAAASRRAELKKQIDNKEKHCILDFDSYKKERLEPQYIKFRNLLPRVTFGRNVLQACIVLFTSTGTVLGALDSDDRNGIKFLIPVVLAFAAVFDNFLKFFQLESKVPVLNQYCFNELNQAMRTTNAPSTLRRRLPTEKAQMVVKVEDAILSYYNFIAEEQLSEGRQKEEESATQLDATNEAESPRRGMPSQTNEGKKANNQDLNAHALGE